MGEQQSTGRKGKKVVRRLGEKVQTATATLSGKNIEQQVAEHSELYTQVLLGLHRDLEAQDKRLSDFASDAEALKRQVASMGRTRLLAIAALVAAVASLAIATVAVVQT